MNFCSSGRESAPSKLRQVSADSRRRLQRQNKNPASVASGVLQISGCELTLAELVTLARAGLTVLLALFHTRITREQTLALE